jgi:hypothetical protein
MLASRVISRVRRTLIDEDAVTWTDAQLLDYLSAAERLVCSIKPDEYVKRETVTLVAGVDQELPDDGLSLFEVLRNASGRAVNLVGKDLLDNTDATWAANTPSDTITEYCADHRSPRLFYVNPPATTSAQVVLLYGALPPALSTVGDTLTVSDVLENALWGYTIALAYAENTKRQDLGKSNQWMAFATQNVAGRETTQKTAAPELGLAERT